jgi:hypothetical protein
MVGLCQMRLFILEGGVQRAIVKIKSTERSLKYIINVINGNVPWAMEDITSRDIPINLSCTTIGSMHYVAKLR